MADPSKFLHSWNLKRSNPLIKLYVFLLGKDSLETINFCKLFWATLFSPILLIILGTGWIIAFGFVKPLIAVGKNHHNKKALQPKKDRVWIRKFLTAFTNGLDKFVGFVTQHSKAIIGLIIIAAMTGVGFLIDYAIYHPNGSLKALIGAGIVAGSIIVFMTLLFVFIWLEEEFDFWSRAARAIGRFVGPKISKPFILLGRGLRVVGHFLAAGFYAVKYRTCPRVIIAE